MAGYQKAVIFIACLIILTAVLFIAYDFNGKARTSKSDAGKAFDTASMNHSVRPGDDFYEYVNGMWIKDHPVPPDKPGYNEFYIVMDKTYERVRDIVLSASNNTTAPEGSLEQKVGELYRVGMDAEAIEMQRLSPIEGELRNIDNTTNASQLQSLAVHLLDYGIDPFFSFYAEPDSKNSKIMVATLSQGGLGLPDRDYYFREDNQSAAIREQYLAHIARMFELLGESPERASKDARTILRIETRLARASFNSVDEQDVVKTYNKMSPAELEAFAPGLDWNSLFTSVGCPDVNEINVRNPPFFKELGAAVQDEGIEDLKTFMRWKLISATAYYLSSDLQEEHFDFYGRKLNGQEEMKPRWKRVLDVEDRILGEAIGRAYVDRYFDPSSKARMNEMVSNLRQAFRIRIQNLTWMEPETKEKALLKLEVLEVQVGYPDEWQDYSGLEVKNDSYIANIMRAWHFQFRQGPHGVDKIGEPVNRRIWEMSPHTINAYADPNKNLMVFPAGILQPPFFNPEGDDAVNYGAIGVAIGHEMIHNFDSQGRKFDSEGNMTEWWTPEDVASFDNSTRVLAEEYDRFEVLPGLYINGNLTLQENIADLGGLIMAYHAYRLSRKAEPEMIDGLTGEQRFFLGFAQMWRESSRDEALRALVLTNPHSPGKFRVNGALFNVPEFYRAFPDVKPGDKLYRPEGDRPVIW